MQLNIKDYIVLVFVAVCRASEELVADIVEEFDTLKDARKWMRKNPGNYCIRYFAAEAIDEDMNLNPACWGFTKKQAIAKLTEVLP